MITNYIRFPLLSKSYFSCYGHRPIRMHNASELANRILREQNRLLHKFNFKTQNIKDLTGQLKELTNPFTSTSRIERSIEVLEIISKILEHEISKSQVKETNIGRFYE